MTTIAFPFLSGRRIQAFLREPSIAMIHGERQAAYANLETRRQLLSGLVMAISRGNVTIEEMEMLISKRQALEALITVDQKFVDGLNDGTASLSIAYRNRNEDLHQLTRERNRFARLLAEVIEPKISEACAEIEKVQAMESAAQSRIAGLEAAGRPVDCEIAEAETRLIPLNARLTELDHEISTRQRIALDLSFKQRRSEPLSDLDKERARALDPNVDAQLERDRRAVGDEWRAVGDELRTRQVHKTGLAQQLNSAQGVLTQMTIPRLKAARTVLSSYEGAKGHAEVVVECLDATAVWVQNAGINGSIDAKAIGAIEEKLEAAAQAFNAVIKWGDEMRVAFPQTITSFATNGSPVW